MKVTNVTVDHYSRGIPLKGWKSVRIALLTYSKGQTASSRATQDNQVAAMTQVGGAMGLGIYALFEQARGPESSFVMEMLKEAESALKNRDSWARHYDYDGVGIFHKTSVDISILDRKEDLYMLEISAAYVGTQPEIDLAEQLGIPLALQRYSVIVQVESEDETHFAIDFGQIMPAISKLYANNKRDSGQEIASHFMSGDKYHDPKPWPLYIDEKTSFTLAPGRVEQRFVYEKPGEPIDTWENEGSILRGLLDTSYEDRSKKVPPSFVLTLTNKQTDYLGHSKPIWDEKFKRNIEILSGQIADAMKKI